MFRDFKDAIKETSREFVTFKVDRGIITDELYKLLKEDCFTNEQIYTRLVQVPVKELKKATTINSVLENIYYYGQNAVPPVDGSPSVSIDDIVNFLDKKYKINSTGFIQITADFYQKML